MEKENFYNKIKEGEQQGEAIRKKEELEALIRDREKEYEEAKIATEKARIYSEKTREIFIREAYTPYITYSNQCFNVKIGEKIPEMTTEGYKLQEAFEKGKEKNDMAEKAYNDAIDKENEIANRLFRAQEKLDKLMQA